MSKKFNIENFRVDGYELLNAPQKYKDYAELKHRECGRIFKMRGDAFVMMGQRCPYCYSKKAPAPDEYRHSLPEGFTTDDDYVGRDVNMVYHHNCGRDFIMTPHNFTRERYCPYCNKEKRNRARIEKFTRILNEFDPDYEFLGVYTKSLDPVEFRHRGCGQVFKMTPNAFLCGSKCPYCRYKESRSEKIISDMLSAHNIEHVRQYTFSDCKSRRVLPFDFAIFIDGTLHCLIEYDGEQHFAPMGFDNGKKKFADTQMRDRIKTEFCKKNNIMLYRITYQDNIEEKINDILGQYIITSGGASCQDN